MHKRLEWIEWYHELEKYYAEHGNIDISVKYITEEGLKLGQWLSTQRSAYTNKKLSQEQIRLLNDLKIIWNKHSESWDTYYYALEEYYMKNGNIDVTKKYETEEGLKLGIWLRNQRMFCSDINREKLLNDLGMIWDKHAENWDTYYYELEKYRDKYGNVNVSKDYVTQDGFKLGLWLKNQRQAYKGNSDYKITQDHIKILNNLNIDWALRDTKLLNMKITRENSNKYYSVLNNRLSHVLDDISYEVSNQITKDNQEEINKQIVKRIWR